MKSQTFTDLMPGMKTMSVRLRQVGGPAGIIGGLLWAALQYLWFLGHGPTGVDEDKIVFSLHNQDYLRFLILPMLLVLVAFISLHTYQKDKLGRPGKAGYVITLTGYGAILLGHLLVNFTFPFGHPVTIVGFSLQSFGLFGLLLIGWWIYGIAFRRTGVLPRWSRNLSLLMGTSVFLALLWTVLDLASISGYPPSVVFATVHGLSWSLLGYALWSHRFSNIRVKSRM